LLELNSPEIWEYEETLFHFFLSLLKSKVLGKERQKEVRSGIQKMGREGFVLSEMQRLGFWPKDSDKPSVAEQVVKRRHQLSQEIRDLAKKQKRFENKEAVLKAYRKERLRKSRELQKLNKAKRADARLAKKLEWKKKQAKDIIYLGEGVSGNLHKKENNLELLAKNHLPITQDVVGLATTLSTTVNELRFLSFQRSVYKKSHYMHYTIPKKAAGLRKISAPMPRLKKVQRAILDELLIKLENSNEAHGFITKRSIVTNANPHVGAEVVINMDLKDFFPSINHNRVYGLFKYLGYSDQISTILALICTQPSGEKVKLHGEEFYINSTSRVLPQGAPTSPAITNIICRKMDARLLGIAKSLGLKYTRYADDLTFSGPASVRRDLNKLFWRVKGVVKSEGFALHPKKTKIMSNGNRKEVTGVVVNEKPAVSRKKLKAFRALLYQIEKDGPKGKHWGSGPDLMESILGYARFIYMVDPAKGKKFLAQVKAIRSKYKPKKAKLFFKPKAAPNPTGIPPKDKGDDDKPWWKIW